MAYHHVALAVSDLAETHRFYTEVMGFELVKAIAAPTDTPGGDPELEAPPSPQFHLAPT